MSSHCANPLLPSCCCAPRSSLSPSASPCDGGCLVIRPGALGDTLLAAPALRALRRRWGRVVLVGSLPAATLLAPLVDAVLGIEEPAAAALFLAENSRDARFRQQVGTPRQAVVWLRQPAAVLPALERLALPPLVIAPGQPGSTLHVTDYLLATLGEPPGCWEPLPVAPETQQEADRLLAARGIPAGAIGLALGAGSAAKCWPVEHFAALARVLQPQPVFALAGPADQLAAARWRHLQPELPLLEDVPLPLLPGVLSRAAAVVANDSGPGHLAAALGVAVVSLFGPSDPLRWAPRGPRVVVLRAPAGALPALTVEAVRDGLTQVLGSR
ncbi:MAG: glycosyltransferase family 9 protein [Chloroflexi bacterium]|nr:glycosyltransferase family 9 protein [Chloroflexota bacterium]